MTEPSGAGFGKCSESPHPGPVVRNPEEFRQLLAEKDRQRAEQPALTLNEEPPEPDKP